MEASTLCGGYGMAARLRPEREEERDDAAEEAREGAAELAREDAAEARDDALEAAREEPQEKLGPTREGGRRKFISYNDRRRAASS